MIKKLRNITNKIFTKIYPVLGIAIIIFVWQLLSFFKIVPDFMLPSPFQVFKAFIYSFNDLMEHSKTTILEAFIGLSFSIILAFVFAYMMDRFGVLYKIIYPVFIITQTIPVVAIAPLLVLWLGYDMTPKIVLIIIVCFFPIVIGLLDGFKSADTDVLNLLRAMGAKRYQIFVHVKFPTALPYFFASLKIAVSYSVVGAVISEWLGGNKGLGVYMTRVRKSYAFDKMFAVILLVSVISLILMWIVSFIEKKSMPWKFLYSGKDD